MYRSAVIASFSREVVLGHFDAAGVAEMVAVRVGVVEPLSLSAADGAGLPVTVLIRAPVAVGAAGRFNMAGIVGADALVRALPVGRPRTPVMAERLSGREGRLVGGSLGVGTADGAGLVIHRLFGTGRSGFQILLLGGFCREAVWLSARRRTDRSGRRWPVSCRSPCRRSARGW